MLTNNQIKEHLALAYVYAVASRCACSYQTSTVDMDSIDVTLSFRNDDDPSAFVRSPDIKLQVKSYPFAALPNGEVPFKLKRKNHLDLVKQTTVPRLLVVVVMPKNQAEWLSLSPEQLVLRGSAFWLNLLGDRPTSNGESITVHLPATQRFDTEALQRFMRQAARRERLL